jgi:hypothetical protein
VSAIAEAHDACLAALAEGDFVASVTGLREASAKLHAWLPEGVDGEQLECGFAALHDELEKCLALAQPLLDFGGERGLAEVCSMLQRLAFLRAETSALAREPMVSLGLHDLAWSLLAECLAADRLRSLPRLASVVVLDPQYPEAITLFEHEDLRHPGAFQRGGENAYLAWREWFCSSELIARLPHLGTRESRRAAAAEADLLAALRFAARHGERSFCACLGEGSGERRLRAHALGADGGALGVALGLGPDGLEAALNERYGLLAGPDEFGRSRLAYLFEPVNS